MKEFDPELSLAENWRTADPLDFAWFGYAPGEMREQYRESGKNPGRTAVLQKMMEREVQLKIGDGELVALGVQVAPVLEDSAREVPPVLFQGDSTRIDWDNGTIAGLGRTFADVRVCVSRALQREASAAPIQTDDAVAPHKQSNVLPPTQLRTKRGPKSAGDVVRQTYHALIQTGEIPHIHTLKEAWNIALPVLRSGHPDLFRGDRGLSYSSFARHIRAK